MKFCTLPYCLVLVLSTTVFIYSYYIWQGTSIEKAPIDRDTSRSNDEEDDDEDDEAEDFPLH